MKVSLGFIILFSLSALAMPEFSNNPDISKMCIEAKVGSVEIGGEDFQVICSPQDLRSIGKNLESLSKNYILGADIDLAQDIKEKGPFKLGTGQYQSSPEQNFTGKFLGNAHTISGYYYSESEEYYVGLFGQTKGAYIANLKIKNFYVQGETYTGSLVGRAMDTTIENVSASNVWIKGHRVQGGLVGGFILDVPYDEGSLNERARLGVENYMAKVLVTGVVYGRSNHTGGIIGYNNYSVTDLVSIVELRGSESFEGQILGYDYLGGITSSNYFPFALRYIYGGKKLSQTPSFIEYFLGSKQMFYPCGNTSVELESICESGVGLLELDAVRGILELHPINLNSEPDFF